MSLNLHKLPGYIFNFLNYLRRINGLFKDILLMALFLQIQTKRYNYAIQKITKYGFSQDKGNEICP